MSFSLLLFASFPFAESQLSLSTPEIVAKVLPAVVLIRGENASGDVQASGFIITTDGKIVTNLHVIRDMKTAGVQLANGEIFDSLSVQAFDVRKDLAILKVSGFDLPTVELGNSNDVKNGEQVILVGSPRGLQGTVTTGVVSAIRDYPLGGGFRVIQTDAAANLGSSGGPLLNSRGQAIGIVTTRMRGSEGLTFALPINYITGMLGNLQRPMSLDELRASLSSANPVDFRSSGYPSRWKHLARGEPVQLRFDGDFIYGEWAVGEQERSRFFSSFEVKKDADAYRGVDHTSIGCEYSTWSSYTRTPNRCNVETKIELTKVTPTRIEGRGLFPPDDAKLECRKCTYSKPFVWQSFVLIPE
ncbi:MAG: trypsin-like peptidase domain-containing protein [Bryobacterales bacterium]|nr:trypsin-like peptidase domain-containing protein [Bryobacterales bacterium]